jgi:hypothetical protein
MAASDVISSPQDERISTTHTRPLALSADYGNLPEAVP